MAQLPMAKWTITADKVGRSPSPLRSAQGKL